MKYRRSESERDRDRCWEALLEERGLGEMAPAESDALRARYESLREAARAMETGAKGPEPLFVLPATLRSTR